MAFVGSPAPALRRGERARCGRAPETSAATATATAAEAGRADAPRAVRAARAVVVGAGPCGLAAALMLAEAGVGRVTVLERGGADAAGAAYSFAVGARGARALRALPGAWERVAARASRVAERVFVLLGPAGPSRLSVRGQYGEKNPPAWLPRAALVAALRETLAARHPAVAVQYGTSVLKLDPRPGGGVSVATASCDADGGGGERTFAADILVGCDGAGSAVRGALAMRGDVRSARGFGLDVRGSPSVGLGFKTLESAAAPALAQPGSGGEPAPLDADVAYVLKATARVPFAERVSPGFLPVGGDARAPRRATVILRADHPLWDAPDAEACYAILERSLPHVPVRALFPPDSVAEFAHERTRRFPPVQRARSLVGHFDPAPGEGPGAGVVLLGDAAHAFPPDLGQGVNSALEDVLVLQQVLERSAEDASIADVLAEYERERDDDVSALMHMMAHGFPDQYGQTPWGMALSIARITLRAKMAQFTPRLFSPPISHCAMSCTPYAQIWRESCKSTQRALAILALVVIAAPLSLVMLR